jgi:hypothetical protein
MNAFERHTCQSDNDLVWTSDMMKGVLDMVNFYAGLSLDEHFLQIRKKEGAPWCPDSGSYQF